MKFRADIEGLRAGAILLVVGHHAEMPGLAAGFVGVDLFFVLSGYLITALLLDELQTSQTIDLPRFFARRFRRLLPALLVMLAVMGSVAALWIPAHRLADSATTGLFASLWGSNIQLALSETDYFATDTRHNLFLHTWSLGVEEQFYAVWPFLLLFLHKLRRGSRPTVTHALILTGLLSFAASLWYLQLMPSVAFYSSPFRAWEFSAGALTYMLSQRIQSSPSATIWITHWSRTLQLVSALALLVTLLLVDDRTPYPGAWAVLPVAAASILLLANTAKDRSYLARCLSHPAMQWIGKLSYGWYLWHWPVLVMGAYLTAQQTLIDRAGLAMLSLGIAWLSFHAVEQPIRQSKALIRHPKRAILAAVLTMQMTALLFFQWWETSSKEEALFRTTQISAPVIYPMGCDSGFSDSSLHPCTFLEENRDREILVIGDSIGLQWFPAILKYAEEHALRLTVLTKSACALVDHPYVYARIGREFKECAQWRLAALAYANEHQPALIIMGSSDTYPFSEKQWQDGTARILSDLHRATQRLVILLPTPTLPFDGPACVEIQSRRYGLEKTAETCSAPITAPHRAAVDAALAAAASDYPNTDVMALSDLVCPQQRCSALRDGQLVYRDFQHLDAKFVERIAQSFVTRLDDTLRTHPAPHTH